MKRSTQFFLCFLLLLSPALIQAQGVNGAFRITGKSFAITQDSLSMVLEIEASHLVTGGNSSLELFPVLRSDKEEKILPGISYRGGMYREAGAGGDFFEICRVSERNNGFITLYSAAIPYENWMDNANLEFRQYLSRDGVRTGLLIKQMMHRISTRSLPADASWSVDRSIIPGMVWFLQPRTEEIKMRFSRSSAHIDYPVGVADVLAAHGNNAAELRVIGKLMDSILSDGLVSVRGIEVTGYCSPEGSFAGNERLSRMRSEGFKRYLTSNYSLKDIPVRTHWVAEDWEGLYGMVESSVKITDKQDILDIIRNPGILPDAKDAGLQQVGGWSRNYGIILKEMYPQLRRIELHIDYAVSALNDVQSKELMYSRPEMLSLEEMMRVASFYEPGSRQYREAYEIAAAQFPADVTACNNAAAAVLLEGDTGAAFRYLGQVEKQNDPRLLINRGTAFFIAGDTLKARADFAEACRSGIGQGCSNLQLFEKTIDGAGGMVRTAEFGAPVSFTVTAGEKTEGYRFAVKSNLLYDVALLPNLALEFPLGGRWSVELEGQWSWWNTKTTHNNCWRIQTAGLELRRWLGDKSLTPLSGHYLGLYGMAGTYDVKFSGRDGYLSDASYSAGISYGYSFPLSRRFNLELGIAAGYLGGKYSVYDQYDSGNELFPLKEKKDMHYFGPTKAKVSLVWIIGGGKH